MSKAAIEQHEKTVSTSILPGRNSVVLHPSGGEKENWRRIGSYARRSSHPSWGRETDQSASQAQHERRRVACEGGASLLQTDFSVTLIKVRAGAVKVRNKVLVHSDVVASKIGTVMNRRFLVFLLISLAPAAIPALAGAQPPSLEAGPVSIFPPRKLMPVFENCTSSDFRRHATGSQCGRRSTQTTRSEISQSRPAICLKNSISRVFFPLSFF